MPFLDKAEALAYRKRHYEENRDRVKALAREYYRRNSEKRRAYQKLLKYGLTPEQHQAMIATQCNRCAICGYEPADPQKPLVVDHCHSSGRVRQLLCSRCNTGLGLFKEDPARLTEAIKYIERHKPTH